ncbi:hypothetical protein AWZ03_011075 [Drosophila navojoa]|uniref:Uncharacterized protein n=1 Tax=Drosophila navojoa TaxID=7232 RepID=A0A484B167_DRONA|nr:uncharacterized protein LOC108657104 [Drosophila navojoa]TDG42506.1 hypothetical protein AWZ03_011075 [Drosophila navojoa]
MCNTTDINHQKLKFKGCCKMSNDEISKFYNLDILTDDELASVGVARDSLIDDYRHLHELSQIREQQLQQQQQRKPRLPKAFISKIKKPNFKSPRKASKTFQYDLLNKFFRCMQSESAGFCRFMEQDLNIITDFQRDTKILLLAPEEREFARYESYFDYLDALYKSGEQDRVISIVAKVMINVHRDPNPIKLLPSLGRGHSSHVARNRTAVVQHQSKLSNS